MYYIFIDDHVFFSSGEEAAWNCFNLASDFGNAIGVEVTLETIDEATGELIRIASNQL